MRSVFLLFCSIFFLTQLAAQHLESVKDLLKQNKIVEAKKAIDNMMAQEIYQKTADAYYVKSKIYNAISLQPGLSKQFPGARMEAFLALKKYTQLDDKMLIALQIDGYKPINEIYTGYYQEAANSFNAKDYTTAFEGFVNAIQVSSFMSEKGWINLKLDTNSVLYAGVSAEKLNHPADAAKYYSLLVNSRVKGEGFIEIYKWVSDYYLTAKNFPLAIQYNNIGKEVYPLDPFWNSLDIDIAREKGNKEELFATYEKTISAEPNNHLYRYNYAVEIYQHAYNTDPSKRPANSEALIQKAATQLSNVIKLAPSYAKAQLFAGQITYNEGVDLFAASKAAADETKKKQLNADALEKFRTALPYFLTVEQLLATTGKTNVQDKADLKEALDLVITIYSQTGEKNKTQEYEAKLAVLKD